LRCAWVSGLHKQAYPYLTRIQNRQPRFFEAGRRQDHLFHYLCPNWGCHGGHINVSPEIGCLGCDEGPHRSWPYEVCLMTTEIMMYREDPSGVSRSISFDNFMLRTCVKRVIIFARPSNFLAMCQHTESQTVRQISEQSRYLIVRTAIRIPE
jgi:hypothetical protein